MTFRRHITIFLNQIYENAEAEYTQRDQNLLHLIQIAKLGWKGRLHFICGAKTELLVNFL